MIAEIETAMLARLNSAKDLGLLGYLVQTIASLGGEFTDSAITAATPALAPGLWVTFLNETKGGEVGWGENRIRIRMRVIVAATTRLSHTDPETGIVSVGSYQLAADVHTLLSGQRFGLDIEYLVPHAVTVFQPFQAAVPGLSVLAVDFITTYVAADAPDQPGAAISAGVPTDQGLAQAMTVGAGSTDFARSDATWASSSTFSDTVSLET